MKVILVTHNREPSYVGDTLESMFRNDDMKGADIHVLVHESESSCLLGWEQSSKLTVHTCTAEQLQEKQKLARRAKCAHVLRLGLELFNEECLYLEDDAAFLPHWWTRFQADLSGFKGNREMSTICLYYHVTFNQPGIQLWNPLTYYGTVAMFFGNGARKEAVKALGPRNRAWDTDNPGVGGDVRLKDMYSKRQKEFPLYARVPQLVHHTGDISSIGSNLSNAKR